MTGVGKPRRVGPYSHPKAFSRLATTDALAIVPGRPSTGRSSLGLNFVCTVPRHKMLRIEAKGKHDGIL